MRLARLHLQAFGPFTDRLLDFGPAGRLVLVHGPNEAGKSSTLRAVSDLRFGIPQQSRDNFVHAHPEMRVGGVFVDGQGREHAVIRRKGRGATLLDAGSLEPVPPELEARLCCGLSKEEYEASFGLDHERLRKGGKALLEGEGEVGAALFEASAGVRSIPQVLERLDQAARRYFMPGARGRHAKINEGLRAYEEHHAAYRQALVRPAHWAELFRKHRAAADALAALEGRRAELHAGLLMVRELRAVAPLLAALDHASRALLELGDAPLLPESAAVERATAQAGLAEAAHNASLAAAEAQRQRERLDALEPDDAVLEAAP
ncbi:MAG TPA: AAA family ATPase, partial [Quisquiliibacterium sp.]|nr:AAA family ATPase [Quisquiliibacterium sp.]